MDLVVLHGDREERVQVRRKDGLFAIQVGDREYSVDAVEVGPDHHSLRIGDDQYEVSIHRETGRAASRVAGVERYTIGGADGKLSANPDGDLVEVVDPLTHLARQTLGGAGAGGRQQVTAYMPGRVVAILKAEGDAVETGEGVVVLEAMKMENEILAESSGTLSKVLVEAGQAVDAGDPLFEIT